MLILSGIATCMLECHAAEALDFHVGLLDVSTRVVKA